MSDNLPTTSTSRRDDDGGAPSPATHDGTITESTSEDAPKKPKPWFKRLSLTTWIFIALILGVLAGLALQGAPDIADTYIKPFGTIFLNLIKMIVVPLVLFSIIAGVVSLDDVKKVGAIGGKTILFYLVTTGFAVTLGLIFANVMNVGAGYVMDTQDLSYEATDPPSFIDTIVNIFPSNFFQPMADATMLQVIVIAVVFGFGMIAAGKKAKPVIDICNALSDVCIAIMRGIILVAPFGVFGLICPVIANNGIDVLRPLLWLIVVAYVAMICQIALVYSGIIKVFARMSPLMFLRKFFSVAAFGFSTATSNATIPLNIETLEKKMGVDRRISSFTIPLGATINMDGTAIMQGVAVVFTAQLFGVPLGPAEYATVIATATLASIGTAGVPSVGLITLSMVFDAVGLPLEGIALIMGIDRILDMCRTAVNITGDAVVTSIVAKQAGRVDMAVFRDPDAGREVDDVRLAVRQ